MDYEKKYKEALERAKVIYQGSYKPDTAATIAETLQNIFTELKESEDECIEKIKKDIISYLNNRKITSITESSATEKWIAWLEKQGKQETLCDKCRKEHPSHSCQDITELGRCAVEHEQKHADEDCEVKRKAEQNTSWSKENEK